MNKSNLKRRKNTIGDGGSTALKLLTLLTLLTLFDTVDMTYNE